MKRQQNTEVQKQFWAEVTRSANEVALRPTWMGGDADNPETQDQRDARMKREGAREALKGLPGPITTLRNDPISYNYREGWNQFREYVDDALAALEADKTKENCDE